MYCKCLHWRICYVNMLCKQTLHISLRYPYKIFLVEWILPHITCFQLYRIKSSVLPIDFSLVSISLLFVWMTRRENRSIPTFLGLLQPLFASWYLLPHLARFVEYGTILYQSIILIDSTNTLTTLLLEPKEFFDAWVLENVSFIIVDGTLTSRSTKGVFNATKLYKRASRGLSAYLLGPSSSSRKMNGFWSTPKSHVPLICCQTNRKTFLFDRAILWIPFPLAFAQNYLRRKLFSCSYPFLQQGIRSFGPQNWKRSK